MEIRRAESKDIPRILEILSQVLEIHANIRPDIFVSGTTKYSEAEMVEKIKDDSNPIYVAVDVEDKVLGYAFCQLKESPKAEYMKDFRTLYIDDLCVDRLSRRQNVGRKLFDYVVKEAKNLGCFDITLNVWTGNDNAEAFYKSLGMKTRERQMEYIL